MAERAGERQLHAHTPGEFLDLLGVPQVEPLQVCTEPAFVPLPVTALEHPVDVPDAQRIGERQRVEDNAQQFLGRHAFRPAHLADRRAHHRPLAAVGADQPQQRLDRGGLARPVTSDVADDLARADGQVHIPQGEVAIPFA